MFLSFPIFLFSFLQFFTSVTKEKEQFLLDQFLYFYCFLFCDYFLLLFIFSSFDLDEQFVCVVHLRSKCVNTVLKTSPAATYTRSIELVRNTRNSRYCIKRVKSTVKENVKEDEKRIKKKSSGADLIYNIMIVMLIEFH